MGDGRLPTFLIIGAMRSGTTALTRYLDAHPQVFMAPEKEVHFFDRHYDRGADWYRSRFAGADGQPSVGEATQTYMFLPEAMPLIAAMLPDARLVAILRNPVDRAYSHYWMNRSQETEQRDPRTALTDSLEDPSPMFPYVDRGRYVDQLRRVCEYYPRSSLHVLLFEDLVAEPGPTFASLCGFLGINAGERPANLGDPVNQHLEYRSLRLRNISKRLPKPIGNLIGKVNGKKTSYPPMEPELRKRLSAAYADDNARLAGWLGRDLAIWD
ncbi:MAG: sulfotransferase family protein [Actinomycetota bacterium]